MIKWMTINNVQNSLCINHFNETGTQWTDRGPWAFYLALPGLFGLIDPKNCYIVMWCQIKKITTFKK